MSTVVRSNLAGGTSVVEALLGGFVNLSATTTPVPIQNYGPSTGNQPIYWYAPYSGIVDAVTAGVFLSSGSTSTTATLTVYKQTGSVGSFSATTAQTNAAVIGTTAAFGSATYQQSGTTAVQFNAGDTLAVYLNTNVSQTLVCCYTVLTVRMIP